MLKFFLLFLLKRYKNKLIKDFDRRDSLPCPKSYWKDRQEWLQARKEMLAEFRNRNHRVDEMIKVLIN